MGYDFNKLDFICFSDPKLSIKDIKQCIGRGIRPDGLGLYGSNKEKILNISLPVYIDENSDNKYEKIIEVLKYLLYDIEIPFEEIEFKNRYVTNSKEK
jgi:predicted helicase